MYVRVCHSTYLVASKRRRRRRCERERGIPNQAQPAAVEVCLSSLSRTRTNAGVEFKAVEIGPCRAKSTQVKPPEFDLAFALLESCFSQMINLEKGSSLSRAQNLRWLTGPANRQSKKALFRLLIQGTDRASLAHLKLVF